MTGGQGPAAWKPNASAVRPNVIGGMTPTGSSPTTTHRFRSAAARAASLRLALGLTMLIAAASAVVQLVRCAFFDAPGNLQLVPYQDLAAIAQALGVAALVALGLTGLLWIAWSRRMEADATALGVGESSIGTQGAVLWWFVPFANLLVPFGLILGLDRRLADQDHPSRDGLTFTWWLAFLLSAGALLGTFLEIAGTSDPTASRTALLANGLAWLLWLAAAWLARRVVASLQTKEDGRAAEALAWTGAAANQLGPMPPGYAAPSGLPGAVQVVPMVVSPLAGAPAMRPGAAAMRPGAAAMQPGAAATRSGAGANQLSPMTARPASYPPTTMVPTGAPAVDGRFESPPRRSPAIVWGVLLLLLIGGALVVPRFLNRAGNGPASTPLPTIAGAGAFPTPQPLATPKPTATTEPETAPPPETAAPIPTEVVTPAPVPSAPTAAGALPYLMDHTVDGDGTCAAAPSGTWPAGSLGAIDCHPPSTAVGSLTYAVFPSPDAASASYQVLLARSKVATGAFGCSGSQAGEGAFTTGGIDAGRVLCYVDSVGGTSTATVVWVDTRLSILGLARGTGSLSDLVGWWGNSSGPN